MRSGLPENFGTILPPKSKDNGETYYEEECKFLPEPSEQDPEKANKDYQLAKEHLDQNRPEEAAALLAANVLRGHLNSYVQLAQLYLKGVGVSQNVKKAYELIKIAAVNGHVVALYDLGMLYLNGWGGVEKSEAKCVEYYTLAASKGYPDAQLILGVLYEEGRIVEQKNLEKAIQYYREAANRRQQKSRENLQRLAHGYWGFFGNPAAKYHLAILNSRTSTEKELPHIPVKNVSLLVELIKKNPADLELIIEKDLLHVDTLAKVLRQLDKNSIPNTVPHKIYERGSYYLQGKNIKPDVEKGGKLLKLAEQAGNDQAQKSLQGAKEFYDKGYEAEKNTKIAEVITINEAASNFREAALRGSTEAYYRLKRLAKGPFWGIFGGGNVYAAYHLACLENDQTTLASIPENIKNIINNNNKNKFNDFRENQDSFNSFTNSTLTIMEPLKIEPSRQKNIVNDAKQDVRPISKMPITHTLTFREIFCSIFNFFRSNKTSENNKPSSKAFTVRPPSPSGD